MSDQELNPNHKTFQDLNGHWQKILALAVFKAGGTVNLSSDDIEQAGAAGLFLTVDARGDNVILTLVDEKTAHVLAKQEGGLPH